VHNAMSALAARSLIPFSSMICTGTTAEYRNYVASTSGLSLDPSR